MKSRALPGRTASHVQRAVVQLERKGGQGVLIPGGYVMTAAHCVEWTLDAGMALGENPEFYQQIVTADGRTLTVSPYAVEPVSDLAVLGAVDGQALPDLADAFEDFCTATRPVPLALDRFRVGVACDAFVFTHDKGIVPARVKVGAPDANVLWIEADEGIEGGTSGGPVVTRHGKLLGVLSFAGGRMGESARECVAARVLLAAPVWLIRKMIPRTKLVRLTRALDHWGVKAKPGKGGR